MTENVKKHEVQMIDTNSHYFISASIYSPTNPAFIGTPTSSIIDHHRAVIRYESLHEGVSALPNPGIIATQIMGAI